MKILIVQHRNFLNVCGGTEKICCFIANTFAKQKHEVTIATNEDVVGEPVFFLEPNVRVENIYTDGLGERPVLPYYNYKGSNPILWLYHKLRKKRAKLHNKLLFRKMKGPENVYLHNVGVRSKHWHEYITTSKPDLIVTMSTASLVEITYYRPLGIPIVNSVNGRPDYDYTDVLGARPDYEMRCLEASYKHLAGIQVLFESYKEFLPESFGGIAKVIANPVPQQTEQSKVNSKSGKHVIAHVGTLFTSCKQQHKIIEIFERLGPEFSQWEVHFYGTGVDLDELKKMVKRANLEQQIHFKGFTDQPLEVMRAADIFVFPSKYEGFPLALTEAMATGLPTIGYAYCSGVNELIVDGKTGFLVADDAAFEQRLREMMLKEALRTALGNNAKKAMKQYSAAIIEASWIDFAEELTQLKTKQEG